MKGSDMENGKNGKAVRIDATVVAVETCFGDHGSDEPLVQLTAAYVDEPTGDGDGTAAQRRYRGLALTTRDARAVVEGRGTRCDGLGIDGLMEGFTGDDIVITESDSGDGGTVAIGGVSVPFRPGVGLMSEQSMG